jgi:hypothetical protein
MSRGHISNNHNAIQSLESSRLTTSAGSEKNVSEYPLAIDLGDVLYFQTELSSLCSNDQNPRKYSLIYLYTGNACKTAKELRSHLNSSRFFRLYDVLAIFPIGDGIWELLVSDICRFRKCAQELCFAVETCGDLRRGLFARFVILWLCSGENLIMREASACYRNLLKRYSFRDVIADMVTAFFRLPKSTVMGCLAYRMDVLRYVRDIDKGSPKSCKADFSLDHIAKSGFLSLWPVVYLTYSIGRIKAFNFLFPAL